VKRTKTTRFELVKTLNELTEKAIKELEKRRKIKQEK
jgi:hypothetical protein